MCLWFPGLTIEAAVDFTGGIPEMIELHRTKLSPERLFMIMEKADRRGAFMGCALSVRLKNKKHILVDNNLICMFNQSSSRMMR